MQLYLFFKIPVIYIKFTNILHLAEMFVLLHLSPLMYDCLEDKFAFLIHVNNCRNTYGVSIQNTNAYEMLSNIHKYFTLATIFVLSYLWSFKYSLLADIFVFPNTYEVLSHSHKYFTFENHISFPSMIT